MTVGIDFGTTNSSIARIRPSGEVELANFPAIGGPTDAYRSLLYLEQSLAAGRKTLKSWSGPDGIEHYLEADPKGRLVLSLKSFLSSRSLQTTEVFGRPVSLEQLIARILRDLREKSEQLFGVEIKHALAGRPVRFVGSESDVQDAYAVSRLEAAYKLAGFASVQFEMEPVAASRYYQSTLTRDELILIGDFGGGTSDFSLVRLGVNGSSELLGNAGVGLAGDAFDAKIVKHVVSPALGAGGQIRSMHKVLPIPNWIYTKLERWHHLSLLRSREVMSTLHDIEVNAVEPAKIRSLIRMVKEDLGFHLHKAVQQAKCELSVNAKTEFRFAEAGIHIAAVIKRADFESWVAEELDQISACVDALLKHSHVKAKDVDAVFLTGGTSFVPAVRAIFGRRFGAARLRAGNEFTSVARGLALGSSVSEAG
jgi:hypothetical chaperone protein